jgi:hypothetical protein
MDEKKFQERKKAFDSVIINETQFEILLKWLPNITIDNSFQLIYKASRDGWLATDFHKFCDNQINTFIIIHVEKGIILIIKKKGNIFGGYVPGNF